MINIDYVNGSIALETEGLFRPYEKFIRNCENEINDIFVNFDVITEKVELESSIMGTVPENMMMVYEAEKTNIFKRIGEFLIKIYNEFMKLIDSVIDKIKNFSFKNKTNIQKLDILVNNHPQFKDEIIASFNEGVLNLDDVKKLKDLDSAWEEVIKLSKKKDIDTKTLKGKIEKAKENFEKDEKTWKVVKVATATTTVITAIKAVKFFIPQCAEVTEKFNKLKQERKEKQAEILEELKNMTDKDGNPIVSDQTGKWRLMLEFRRWIDGKTSVIEKRHVGIIEKLANGITSLLDKVGKSSGESFKYDLEKTSERKQRKKEAADDDDLKKKVAETISTTSAQAEVRNTYTKKYEDEDRKRKVKDTIATTEARKQVERQ